MKILGNVQRIYCRVTVGFLKFSISSHPENTLVKYSISSHPGKLLWNVQFLHTPKTFQFFNLSTPGKFSWNIQSLQTRIVFFDLISTHLGQLSWFFSISPHPRSISLNYSISLHLKSFREICNVFSPKKAFLDILISLQSRNIFSNIQSLHTRETFFE